MKFENTEVFNFSSAFRGMRNPKNSWEKSDSIINNDGKFIIGPNDLILAQTLISGGPVHSKFLRQIFISVDITAPLYFWSEMDTYKIGTSANSCSTMHKLCDKKFTRDDFQQDISPLKIDGYYLYRVNTKFDSIIDILNQMRDEYNKTKNYDYVRKMKQFLPTAYLQKRTWTANYEVLRNIYKWRQTHRLAEWRVAFCDWVKTLPYFEELIGFKNIIESEKTNG